MDRSSWDRRAVLKLGVACASASLGPEAALAESSKQATDASTAPGRGSHWFRYDEEQLNHIAFPMGGMGAGMLCMAGNGAFTQVSLRNNPDLFHRPAMFAALHVKGRGRKSRALLLEGPVAPQDRMPVFDPIRAGRNLAPLGLPRFSTARFASQFPFCNVELYDDDLPIAVSITGWSPFEPGDEDNSSLPVAGLEYVLTNSGQFDAEIIFSFNSHNFMAPIYRGLPGGDGDGGRVRPLPNGFVLEARGTDAAPWNAGGFAVWTDRQDARINHAWFRGVLRDLLRGAWRDVERGACFDRPPSASGPGGTGATIFVPLTVPAGSSKTIKLGLAWFVPRTDLMIAGGDDRVILEKRTGSDRSHGTHVPWYAARFDSIDALSTYWRDRYADLRVNSKRFAHALHSSTVPSEIVEAVAANLTVLKSPTVLRQADGRLWGWEGSYEVEGSCPGSCTHVWNFSQALAHLFPGLERGMRETDFGPSLRRDGHQSFRTTLPIRSSDHDPDALPSADGQLGSIVRTYREWRISGDTPWIASLWPKIRLSLDYAITRWDPRHRGWLEEPQHVTLDVSLWGPNGMGTSIYLAALQAAVEIGSALHQDVSAYRTLLARGVPRFESRLFNGEFFFHKVQWRGLKARLPDDENRLGHPIRSSPDELAVATLEGPKYQYGTGCFSMGVLGSWLAWTSGLELPFDRGRIASHLRAVLKHNFKSSLSDHVNLARPAFAQGEEGGLVLCTWPQGKSPTQPFAFASEVWTGTEYQVASELIAQGMVEEGLKIVRACRARYNGRFRNPFAEAEAGFWYVRAMASYALIAAISGCRFDAVDKVLYLHPKIKGDFRCFLSTATGYGLVGVEGQHPVVEVIAGTIPYERIDFRPKPSAP